MPGALTFGAATSDKVSLGAGTGLANLDPMTILAWVYPTTLTTNRNIYARGEAVTARRTFRTSGVVGDLQISVSRTVNTNYITNSTPLATLNRWYCVVATFNSLAAVGQLVNIYTALLGGTLTEATYGTATDGSGAVVAEASAVSIWGNTGQTSPVNAWQGGIAMGAVFAVELSLADCQSWMQRPRLTVGANTAAAFGRAGKYGNDWIEYSANTGTVTGATQSDGSPLDEGDLLWQRDPLSGLLRMVA